MEAPLTPEPSGGMINQDRLREMIVDLVDQVSKLDRDPFAATDGEELAGLGPPGVSGSDLAYLPSHDDIKSLKELANIRSDKYWNAAFERSEKLFSIVLGGYRPATLMSKRNTVDVPSLTQRISLSRPETWASWIGQWEDKFTRAGDMCFRADTEAGKHIGSGFVSSDGESFTAGHVLRDTGWLFGNPPLAGNERAILQYGCFGSGILPERRHYATNFALGPEIVDTGLLKQDLRAVFESEWMMEGAANTWAGLKLEKNDPGDDFLRNRKVAVIGHPAGGNSNGRHGDIELVYPDGIFGRKRFMPGLLDHEPIVHDEAGFPYLVHDCSTLAGASGGPLIDLETGGVLGIHVGGNGLTGNRAVPAWLVLEYMEQMKWTF